MIKKILIPLLLVTPLAYAFQSEQPDIDLDTGSGLQMDALGSSQEKVNLNHIKENASIGPTEVSIVISSDRISTEKVSIVGFMKGKKDQIGNIIPNVLNKHEIMGLYMKRQGNTCIATLEIGKDDNMSDLIEIKSIQFEGLTEEIDFSNAKIISAKKNVSLMKQVKCEYFQAYDNMPNIVNKIIIKKEPIEKETN